MTGGQHGVDRMEMTIGKRKHVTLVEAFTQGDDASVIFLNQCFAASIITAALRYIDEDLRKLVIRDMGMSLKDASAGRIIERQRIKGRLGAAITEQIFEIVVY